MPNPDNTDSILSPEFLKEIDDILEELENITVQAAHIHAHIQDLLEEAARAKTARDKE